MFVSGESIEAECSLSDLVLIKQLAKKNSCPPQVLNYSELPGPAWPVLSETWADLQPATFRGTVSAGGCPALTIPHDSGHNDQGAHPRLTPISYNSSSSHQKITCSLLSLRASDVKKWAPHSGNSQECATE